MTGFVESFVSSTYSPDFSLNACWPTRTRASSDIAQSGFAVRAMNFDNNPAKNYQVLVVSGRLVGWSGSRTGQGRVYYSVSQRCSIIFLSFPKWDRIGPFGEVALCFDSAHSRLLFTCRSMTLSRRHQFGPADSVNSTAGIRARTDALDHVFAAGFPYSR